MRAAVDVFLRLPARALIALITLYRRIVSPALPALTGSQGGCRFYPSCSVYAAVAIDAHGAVFGSWLAARRLAKCSPFHPGGFDPVPPRRSPRCVRVTT